MSEGKAAFWPGELLGDWLIEIGLWVGSTASPNRLGGKGNSKPETAVARVRAFRRDGKEAPLKTCPWGGSPFDRESFRCVPNDNTPRNMEIYCARIGSARARLRVIERPLMAKDVLRLSQVVGMFGPGAMLDLPDCSVLVGGLDQWEMNGKDAFTPFNEWRLTCLLEERLRGSGRIADGKKLTLRLPPLDPGNSLGGFRDCCYDLPDFGSCAMPSPPRLAAARAPVRAELAAPHGAH